MSVTRIDEAPRVTKPYTRRAVAGDRRARPAHRRRPARAGRAADDGRRADVRRASTTATPPEWNTAALGPQKRQQGDRRCCSGCATASRPAALLHFGQGKWYPGESLPRWAFGCYWRRDGEPIWHDPALVADEDSDYGFGGRRRRAVRRRAGRGARRRSGLTRSPGYEDAWYYLWRERRLPANVDPLEEQAGRPGGARPAGEGLRAEARQRRRLRPAAAEGVRARARRGRAGRGSSARSTCS